MWSLNCYIISIVLNKTNLAMMKIYIFVMIGLQYQSFQIKLKAIYSLPDMRNIYVDVFKIIQTAKESIFT